MKRRATNTERIGRRRLHVGFCGAAVLYFVLVLAASPWAGWAQADAHAVAPTSGRQAGETASNKFIGSAKCLNCHTWAASQPMTGMGMAAAVPGGWSDLNYDGMRFQSGAYTVTMAGSGTGLQMKVTGEEGSLSLPVRWIFGQGKLGQTFLLEQKGQLYESRASFYKATGNLDLTIGHSAKTPMSLMAALGRPLGAPEVAKCFSCHTSDDVVQGSAAVAEAHPGITCEKCHGPGSEHMSNMLSVRGGLSGTQDTAIVNPGKLLPADMNDFCGTCHRTTLAVLASGVRDVRNVRFQPYRLENSRCFDPSDARSACIACHDPHRELEVSSVSYDDKCLACHARRGVQAVHAKAAACPKADKACVSCHMPKVELPGAHYAFTDHYIRVVQPGAPYPN